MDSSGQIPLAISGDDQAAFENFWVGHNAELVAALKSTVVRNEPKLIYLYGPHDSGKSHLIYALMRLAKTHSVKTSYLSLSDPSVSPAMLDLLNVSSIVCIDGIHHWAGDVDRERALFAIFEQMKAKASPLILSSNQAPDQTGFSIPDLISRLASGLVYSMSGLNDEQHFEAIKMRARHRGLSISDETVRYLLSRSSRNIGDLLATLDRIDKASLIEKRKITIPFLQTLLSI